jgi:hypothetical protein
MFVNDRSTISKMIAVREGERGIGHVSILCKKLDESSISKLFLLCKAIYMITIDKAISSSIHNIALSQEDLQFYKEEGYLVIRNLISSSLAKELRLEILEIMEEIGLGLTKLKQTQQYLKGSKIDSFVNSLQLQKIASELMEGPSTLYLPFTAVKSAKGGGKFHFHQDNQYTQFDGPGINLWTAMTPMSLQNGCLQVVRRSHLNGTLPSEASGDGDSHRKVVSDPTDFIPIEMEPGDCVAFSRLTVHGSGANQTDQHRVAYAAQFHRDDVKARMNGEWKLLKKNPRWTDIDPVEKIAQPSEQGRDGH